jgi:hypothetical protein
VVEAASAKAAEQVALGLLARRPEIVTVTGAVVTVTSPNFAGGGGRLGADPTFQRLISGAPAGTDIALYADLIAAVAPGRFRTFKAGLAVGVEDGEYVGVARLVFA